MNLNPGEPYIVPTVILFLIVSIPLGLFAWAFLAVVGLAAIQAGLAGLRETGYEWIGGARINGMPARALGRVLIAIGIGWELIVAGSFVFAVCGITFQ